MDSKSQSGMDLKGGDADPQSTQDLTVFVQNLLQQMQTRFQTMSNAIIGRIDEMGTRIDELEKSIGELMTQAGIEEDLDKSSKAGETDKSSK